MNRLPAWFRQEIPDTNTIEKIQSLSSRNIHTVCQEAKCPNLTSCFKNSRLTFMILGNTCTRNCRFCGVAKGSRPLSLNPDEPFHIAEVVKQLSLKYVVITSVARDDLRDGGASIFAKTIELIHNIDKNIKVETLIPDFLGRVESLEAVIGAHPCVIGHNIETVQRLYKELRPCLTYAVALGVLSQIKKLKPQLITKSSLMLGLGETEAEVVEVMEDLRSAQCDILTLGQYLAPSAGHYPVKEFISIGQFDKYRRAGLALGFKAVLSGPKVRSSYQAEEVHEKCMSSLSLAQAPLA